MASTQRLLCCLPTDDFAICLCYIMYNVQKERRPLIPMESLGTLSIQPICLPAFVIPWCLHQYSGDRKTWKHVTSVATPADGERKSTSMDCVFRHTVKKRIKQECTDSGRIQMDSYPPTSCFTQANLTFFRTPHGILETCTKPSPHSIQSGHKQKSFCGAWLAGCSLPLHNAALTLAEGTHLIKCVSCC